jgi:PPK2 family polyphosphate:nucleotide phosphotransferase
MDHTPFIVSPGRKFSLKKFDTSFTGKFKSEEEASSKLEKDITDLAKLQDVLYAQDTWALLLIFQAMDAAGKDGTIKHVMSGVNPQGCQVFSFKAPSKEELDHDFLWRSMKCLPERGRIGIFNRSYYEEVLVVRVHKNILESQQLPGEVKGKKIWERRYDAINNFERYLTENGIVTLKFFLHVSKEEQKKRFLERIERPEKNWKFSAADAVERQHWDAYMEAYEKALRATSTAWAPWYVIPADNKWFTRAAVADIIVKKLKSLDLKYPVLDAAKKADLARAKKMLQAES